MKRIFTLLFLFMATGCGEAPVQHTSSSQFTSLGSWSTTVGGSLAKLNAEEISHVLSSRFFIVRMPVGLGIYHEFVGVELMYEDGPRLHTTGLVGDADAAYWRDHRWDPRHVTMIRYFNGDDSRRAIHTLQRRFDGSVYQNTWIYSAAMLATPLLGRPCAKTSRDVSKLLERL